MFPFCPLWCLILGSNEKDTDLTVWHSLLIWVHSTRSYFLSMAFLPLWLGLHCFQSRNHASFSTDLDLQLAEQTHCAWCLMPPCFVFTLVKILCQQKSSCKPRCLQPSLKFSAGSNMEYASSLAWFHGQTSRGRWLMITEAARLQIDG